MVEGRRAKTRGWWGLLAVWAVLPGCEQCPPTPGGGEAAVVLRVVPSPARVALVTYTAAGRPVADGASSTGQGGSPTPERGSPAQNPPLQGGSQGGSPIVVPPGQPSTGGGGGQQPTDCQGVGVTLVLDRPAVPGGVRLEYLADPPGPLEVLTVEVPAGQTEVPLRVVPRAPGRVRLAYKTPNQRCALGRDCPFVEIEVGDFAVQGQCGLCAPEAPPPPPVAEVVSACDRGEFFVEARLGSRTPCADFAERLRTALTEPVTTQPNLERDLGSALCAWGDVPGCARPCDQPGAAWGLRPGFTPEVEITPVLTARPEDPAGALRFYRVRFLVRPAGGPAVAVTVAPDRVCDVNARLRIAVSTVVANWRTEESNGSLNCLPFEDPERTCDGAVPAFDLAVGQECPLRPSQTAAVATESMLSWHLDRLRERGGVDGGALPTAGRVALIDSGIDQAVRGPSLQVVDVPGFADPASDAARLGHGTAMALLIAQVAPQVPIHSLRIFDGDGITSTRQLARALEHAIYALPGDDPLLINLSLGWPGEFSLPFDPPGVVRFPDQRGDRWQETQCRTGRDDGVGESVRYVLSRARDSARRPVTVVAAAGNLPLDGGDLRDRQRRLRGTDCSVRDPDRRDEDVHTAWCVNPGAGQEGLVERAPLPHLPAGFGLGKVRPPSARDLAPGLFTIRDRRTGQCVAEPLAVAVGALDARDLPVHYLPETMGDELPRVVAPGAHVYFQHAGLTQAVASPTCPSAPPPPFTAPGVITGSSAAAALTTGYLARLLGVQRAGFVGGVATGLPATGDYVLTGGTAPHQRLLQALGASAGVGPQRDVFRRPSLCRLARVGAPGGTATPPVADAGACARALVCVGLGRADGPCAGLDPTAVCGLDADCARVGASEQPTLPAALVPAPCLSVTASTGVVDGPPCLGVGCLTANERGRIGPQPDDPICPECMLFVRSPGEARIRLEFGAKFPFTTHRVSDPRVVIRLGGKKLVVPIDMGSSTPKPGWVADLSGVKLDGLPVTDGAGWKAGGQATFEATVTRLSDKVTWTHGNEMRVIPEF